MKTTKETSIVTLAAIRKSKGGNTEYLFNERQRIFSIRPGLKTLGESSRHLQRALSKKLPVKVVLQHREAIIERVEAPEAKEADAFLKERSLVDKPEKALKVDVFRIDPTTFNIVDLRLKCPVFRLCTRVIPNYTTAKTIFDFCAKQSCSLPGPYNVSPCIPFQYVRDGCHARAHKMRTIITNKYRYCCEKVFSFANQGSDVLSVKADKWGGCCVAWWFHVAPLVRVRVRFGRALNLVLAMVIDPGMFDKPVLLSTWLAAQENSACNSNAHVSMYSIQSGSAYTPADFSGTTFTTDPALTSTNAILTAYQNLTTCP